MKKYFLFSLALFYLSVQSVHAAPLSAADRATLKKVESYLNSLTTISADFLQVAPDGTLTGGKFYLKRPGKMRWQYDPPTPVLMVTKGDTMVYYDYDLQQVSYVSINDSLTSFITQNTISFDDKEIVVDNVEKSPGAIRITLHQAEKPKDGTLVLEFADMPMQLRNMVVTDARKQTTSLSLGNARFGVPLDDTLFEFRDPRPDKRKRK